MNLYVDERRLLDVWEEASALSRLEKEVALLAAVTDQSPEQCARLPIGERDRLLLLLHERTFGGRHDCETRCTSCGMRMAFSFATGDLGLEPRTPDPEELILTEGRIVVKLHLPNSADIAKSLAHTNPVASLFASCVRVQSSPAHRISQMRPNDLPSSLRQSVIERLAALDCQADLMFELECPSCEHDNRVLFDPVVALFRQAEQFKPAGVVLTKQRAALQGSQSGPGATPSDFLERLVLRHSVDEIIHPLRAFD